MAININPPTSQNPESLIPKRNPGLLRRIANAFVSAQPDMGPQSQDMTTTSTGIITEGTSNLYDRQFKFDVARRAIYKDVEEMDQSSPEVSVALDTIADNVISSEDGAQMNFVIMAKNPKAQEVFDSVMATCKLHQKIRPLVRNFIKYGDSFSEIVVNGAAEVTDFRQLPPTTMFRNETLQGQLLTGTPKFDPVSQACVSETETCAFEQKAESTAQMLTAFYPWQIVHLRLNHDGFSPYGRSHLRVSRILYRQLKALEESLIVGRLTRDLLKLIFYVDTTNLSKEQKRVALSDFQQGVSQRIHVDGRRENPFSVMTDFFISTGWVKLGNQVQPSQTKVDVIDPTNAGLHDVSDIEYLHRKFIVTLRVPPAHLGFEKDVNAKSTLGIQDVQYVRFLRSIQQLVGHGLEQLFDTALILAGLDPENEEYDILWPRLAAVDILNSAQAEQFQSAADQVYGPAGIGVIDAVWIAKHRYNMSDEEIKEVQDRITKLKQEQDAQEAAQQQQVHDRQLDLAQAKSSAMGFTKKAPKTAKNAENEKDVNSRYTEHKKGENDASRRAISQEVKILASTLGQKVGASLESELERISQKVPNGNGEHKSLDILKLESMFEALKERQVSPTFQLVLPKQDPAVVEFKEGAFKTEINNEGPEINFDKGAIQSDTSVNLEMTEDQKPEAKSSRTKYKIKRKDDGTYEVEKS